MKFIPSFFVLALVCTLSACGDDGSADTGNNPDTTAPRETRRDAGRDTIHIGTHPDDEVEIRITE